MTARARAPLSSVQNPRVKAAVALRERRARDRSGLILVEGARELLRALDGGHLPTELFVCPEHLASSEAHVVVARCEAAGVPVCAVTAAVMRKLAFGDRSEGLLGIVGWAPLELEGLERTVPLGTRGPALLLVLEGIEKPGNLGALLRTADAAAVTAVVAADPVTDLGNPNAVRASLGTLFTVPVARAQSVALQGWLRQRSIVPVIATPEAEVEHFDADLTGPIAIVLGAEHAGLSAAWRTAETKAVRIAMSGRADSLNVSAAAAVLLFEAVRQRRTRLGRCDR